MKYSELKINDMLVHKKHGLGRVQSILKNSVSLIYGRMTLATLSKSQVLKSHIADKNELDRWVKDWIDIYPDIRNDLI